MPTTKQIKEAEQLRISNIGDIKQRMGGVLELPSGAVVKVRNPGGLKAFIGGGVKGGSIPNGLMVIIQNAIKKGKQPDAEELMGTDGKLDPEMLANMSALMDNVLLSTIVTPRVYPLPTDKDVVDWNKKNERKVADPEELRELNDDLLYVDEFPDDDKQFLFQWVSGGTRDLEEFRRRRASNLDSLAAVTSISEDPK